MVILTCIVWAVGVGGSIPPGVSPPQRSGEQCWPFTSTKARSGALWTHASMPCMAGAYLSPSIQGASPGPQSPSQGSYMVHAL